MFATSRRGRRAATALVVTAAVAGAACTTPGTPTPTTPTTPTTGTATTRPVPGGPIDVAGDGSGRYRTVQAAVDAIPAGNRAPVTIRIARGTYRGIVRLPDTKAAITLVGATGNAADVVITESRSARSAGGNEASSTVLNASPDSTIADLTIVNAYDEAANGASQAVALTARNDRQVYRNVRILGNQDTLLTWTGSATTRHRQLFTDCYVEGDVDFIFGSGTAVFDGCEIRSLSRGSTSNNGYVTAPATNRANPYGFLFVGSRFTSNAPGGTVYLGRPWQPGGDPNAVGQVVIRESSLGAHVRTSQPWTDMSGFSWRNARFAEHRNTGPGAGVNANRPQLTEAQAATHTRQRYLAGSDGWNPPD
jgi:pectinesterase